MALNKVRKSSRAIFGLTNQLVDLNYDDGELKEVPAWDDGFTAADIEGWPAGLRDTDLIKRIEHCRSPLRVASCPGFFALQCLRLSKSGR